MQKMYLTEFEQKLLQTLHPSLFAAGKQSFVTETTDAYETPADLDSRMRILAQGEYPEIKKLADHVVAKLERGTSMEKFLPEDISDEALMLILFGIGALGMTAIIEFMIRDAHNEQQLQDIAEVTKARRMLLETNASVAK